MKTMKKGISPLTGFLISVAGTIVSVIVTIQLKKMLEAKGLPERSEDLKAALKKAGYTAADLKDAATAWIADKATSAADSAQSTAADVAAQVKEKANG